MTPRSPSNDVVDILAVNSVFPRKFATPVTARNVFVSHLSHQFISNFGMNDLDAAGFAPTEDHIVDIFDLSSFDDVARVYARRMIAGVAGARLWPSTMGDIKYNPVSERHSSLKLTSPVSILMLRKRPQKAVVRVVVSNRRKKPVTLQDFGRILRHRCSSKAMVLGRTRCLSSGSPFTLSQQKENKMRSLGFPSQDKPPHKRPHVPEEPVPPTPPPPPPEPEE